jgi:hemoglobin-like flavoprotein
VRLVRDSWAQVAPHGAVAATLFYEQLFALDGKLQHLFRSPPSVQGGRLMQMLDLALAGLDRPETLVPVLRRLGERHVGYGVDERHYALVGQALLTTLQTALGPAFTAPVRDAWCEVYAFVSAQMMEAASEVISMAPVPSPRPAPVTP